MPSTIRSSHSGTRFKNIGIYCLLWSSRSYARGTVPDALEVALLFCLCQKALVADRSRPDYSDARARLSDALARAGRGSQSALAEIYEATSAKLFGISLRILGDRGEAEDALQDIYLNVWRKAGSFDAERASPITWLATLARNRSIDRLRALGGRRGSEPVEAALQIPDPSPDAAASLESSQSSAQLGRCISELEERKAEAIRTSFFEGATYAELAERSGVPLGTMKSWIRRGLLQLKECLER